MTKNEFKQGVSMSKFIWLTKIEYDEIEEGFDEIPLFVNVDAIAYVNSKVVHLKTGETILCKECNEEIADLITNKPCPASARLRKG